MTAYVGDALVSFFTSPVELADCPHVAVGGIFLEERGDGWVYPWRVVKRTKRATFGYPCGEPKKQTPCMCGATSYRTEKADDGLMRTTCCGCH